MGCCYRSYAECSKENNQKYGLVQVRFGGWHGAEICGVKMLIVGI
jgi:hypothetical protein